MGWVATYIPAEIEIYEILGKLYSTYVGACLIWQTSKSVGIISHFPVFPPTSVKLLLICRQNERRRVREGEIREGTDFLWNSSEFEATNCSSNQHKEEERTSRVLSSSNYLRPHDAFWLQMMWGKNFTGQQVPPNISRYFWHLRPIFSTTRVRLANWGDGVVVEIRQRRHLVYSHPDCTHQTGESILLFYLLLLNMFVRSFHPDASDTLQYSLIW